MCFKKKIVITEPVVTPLKAAGKIDAGKIYAIIQAKLDELKDTQASIFIPDMKMKVYNKEKVMASHELEEVDSLVYASEEFDCDDFAAELYGRGMGLVWTQIHALNWFVDTTDTFWFIEPQTKKISQSLEEWQGSDCRFFLGR